MTGGNADGLRDAADGIVAAAEAVHDDRGTESSRDGRDAARKQDSAAARAASAESASLEDGPTRCSDTASPGTASPGTAAGCAAAAGARTLRRRWERRRHRGLSRRRRRTGRIARRAWRAGGRDDERLNGARSTAAGGGRANIGEYTKDIAGIAGLAMTHLSGRFVRIRVRRGTLGCCAFLVSASIERRADTVC